LHILREDGLSPEKNIQPNLSTRVREGAWQTLIEDTKVHTVYVDVLSDAWPEELPTDIKLAA